MCGWEFGFGGYVKLPGSAKDLGRLHIGCVWGMQKYSGFSLDAGAAFSFLRATRDFNATVVL